MLDRLNNIYEGITNETEPRWSYDSSMSSLRKKKRMTQHYDTIRLMQKSWARAKVVDLGSPKKGDRIVMSTARTPKAAPSPEKLKTEPASERTGLNIGLPPEEKERARRPRSITTDGEVEPPPEQQIPTGGGLWRMTSYNSTAFAEALQRDKETAGGAQWRAANKLDCTIS